jgi:hypothetical protein
MEEKNKRFLSDNWKFFVIFVMLGVVMYWTAYVIQPTLDILNYQSQILKIEHNQSKGAATVLGWILDNITHIDITTNVTNIEKQLDHILANLTEIQNQPFIRQHGDPIFNTN